MTADIVPTAAGTRAEGNSSRMMPNASGNTAPAAPWITRAAISTPMFNVMAARTPPMASVTRTPTRVRFLPTMSPTRPRIGVKIASDGPSAGGEAGRVIGQNAIELAA
jgi:hypothetical protein